MSSILEALKKAERESTEGRDADLPLPAPLPKRSPYPMVRRRWWLPLGTVGVLCLGIALFWQFQRPDPSGPTDASTPPPIPDKQTSSPAPTRRAEKPEPLPAPRKMASAAVQAPAAETAPAPRAEAPTATAVPVHPPQQTVRNAPPPMVSKAPPANPPKTRPQPPSPELNDATAPADPSRAASRDTVKPSMLPTSSSEKSDKIYRSDPRIELQALVWSPDAAERFVIVNDRLIKEGGSVEGITIVRINPDDVLVSEGSQRWHEAFKIR